MSSTDDPALFDLMSELLRRGDGPPEDEVQARLERRLGRVLDDTLSEWEANAQRARVEAHEALEPDDGPFEKMLAWIRARNLTPQGLRAEIRALNPEVSFRGFDSSDDDDLESLLADLMVLSQGDEEGQ